MTATAFALDPALDIFDEDLGDARTPRRPQLRLIEGEGFGQGVALTQNDLVGVEARRRRRFLALLAVSVLVLGIAWAAGISVTSFAGASAPATSAPATSDGIPTVHVVLPGDSYGAIASELGAVHPIAAAEVLRAANGGAELVVGQRLVVDANLGIAVLQAGA